MTHSVDELRAALDDMAQQVTAPDADVLVDTVGGRVERSRRRARAGVLAAAAAAALIAATAVGLRGFGPDTSSPVPAQSPSPTGSHRTTHPTDFVDHAGGYVLAKVVNVPLSRRGSTAHKVHVSVPKSSVPITVLKALGSTRDAPFPTGKVTGPPHATTSLKSTSDKTPGTRSTLVWRRGALPVGPGGTAEYFQPGSAPVQSGSKLTLWAVTTLKHPRKTMPVGVYSPVPWSAYPVGKAPFTHVPKPPSRFSTDGFTADAAHRVTLHSGKHPRRTVTASFTWPKGDRGMRMLLLPTTTGRFRVTIDGHVQVCDSGRDAWCYFWDSDLSEGPTDTIMGNPAFMKHPHHTITVEAQGTTGAWRVIFVPGRGGYNKTATASPSK